MQTISHRILGTMSGSSLDGLDLAICTFEFFEQEDELVVQNWSIGACDTISFPNQLFHQLEHAHTSTGLELMHLDHQLGIWMGEQIKHFLNEHGSVEYIASHGHTVFHAPNQKMTTQIGNGAHQAAISGRPVINQFRLADIAAGGVGAPFAPLVDQQLLSQNDYYLNLGGIANLTIREPQTQAWDLCGCNQLLNFLAQKMGKAYDHDGQIAESGRIDENLRKALNNALNISLDLPFALGNEDVRNDVLPILMEYRGQTEDAMRTVVAHNSDQISGAIRLLQSKSKENTATQSLMVSGGGALNAFLISQLRESLKPLNVTVEVPSNELVEFKEALLIAYMGLLRWHERANSLPSVTGAHYPPIGGVIHLVPK